VVPVAAAFAWDGSIRPWMWTGTRPPPAPAKIHHDGERRLIRAGRHRCRRTGAARAMHACKQSKASAALCHRSVRPSVVVLLLHACMRAR
jgi:hypothetical protein